MSGQSLTVSGFIPINFPATTNADWKLINTTISYDEAPGSPRESMSGNIFKSSRTFIVPWAKRWTFCAGMVGWPTLRLDTSSTYWISRTVPFGYSATDFDATIRNKFLYASSIESLQGEGRIQSYDVDGVAQYAFARVTIGFENLSYRVFSDLDIQVNYYAALLSALNLEDAPLPVAGDPFVATPVLSGGGIDEGALTRFVTKFQQPTAEYLTLPFGGLQWVQPGGAVKIPGTIGKIISATEVMFIWHQVPNIPEAVSTHIGTVNKYDFGGYPRGTLLLTSIDVKPYRWFFNSRVYDITYKMKYFQPVPGFDGKRDLDNKTMTEVFGNNHFLRFKLAPDAGDDFYPQNNLARPIGALPPSGKPTYQMVTNDGARPFNNPYSNDKNITANSGNTVYDYADFRYLFTPRPAVVPPE